MFKKIGRAMYGLTILGSLTAGAYIADKSLFQKFKELNNPPIVQKAMKSPKFLENIEERINEEYTYLSINNFLDAPEFLELSEEERQAKELFQERVLPELNVYLNTEQQPMPEIRTGKVVHLELNPAYVLALLSLAGISYCAVQKKKNIVKKLAIVALPVAAFTTAFTGMLNIENNIILFPAGTYKDNQLVYNVTNIRDTKYSLAVIIAHEYVHYLQDKKNLMNKNSVYSEGTARFIECELAKILSLKELQSGYSDISLEHELSELVGIYFEACRIQNKPPAQWIFMSGITPFGLVMNRSLLHQESIPNPYPVGNILFKMYLEDTGKQAGDVFKEGLEDFDDYLEKEFGMK